MKLFEVFNTVAQWRWTRQSAHAYVAEFRIGQCIYVVTFEGLEDDDGGHDIPNVELDFTMTTVGVDNVRDIPTHKLTNTGNAYQVFATIHDILNDYVKKADPDSITFSAKEPSRQKLYKRFVKLLSTKGWETKQRGSDWTLYAT